jgi:hypothetical protein
MTEFASAEIMTCPRLCRFLDAGSTETFRTLSQPASKKRRGTKSREGWRRLGGDRYGDLMRGPVRWGPLPWSEATCMPARERAKEREKRLSRLLKGMSGRRAH